jgi:hypothetical protein
MKLTGMMAAPGRFISMLGEKDLPFFKLLLYISASSQVISAVLVVERPEEGQHYPVQ